MTYTTTRPESPSIQSDFFSIGGKVLVLALPLMVGSFVAAGQSVAKLTLLSYANDPDALFTMAMVTPGFILMLAFMEALAIANQVFSSKSCNDWPRGDVMRSTRVLSLVGAILISLVALLIFGAQNFIPTDSVIHPILPDMALFVVSFIPFFLFEVRNAAIRGQGKTALALLPFGVVILFDLGITAIGIMVFDMGFDAVLIGNVVGPIVAFPLVNYLLRREFKGTEPSTDGTFKRHMIGMFIGVAVPIFLTTFAGSLAAMVIFPMLANFEKDAASSFLLIIRLRVVFIIPAIAAGSAIAIMINKNGKDADGAENQRILMHGVGAIALIYALATALLFFFHEAALGPFVPNDNPSLELAAQTLLLQLVLTFFFIAIGTMLQVILEHLGWGVLVLVATLVAEAITIGWAFWLLQSGGDMADLTMVMNIAAGFSLIAFFTFFLRLIKSQEPSRAV